MAKVKLKVVGVDLDEEYDGFNIRMYAEHDGHLVGALIGQELQFEVPLDIRGQVYAVELATDKGDDEKK